MAYTLRLTDRAAGQLALLPKHIQKRVGRWLELISEDPHRPPSKQLEDYPELRRVHASKDYVIVYSVIAKEVVVLVVRIAHRGDVYRRL